MSTSSISSTPSAVTTPPQDPSYYRTQDTTAQSKAYDTNNTYQTQSYKDGDQHAAEQKEQQRAPLPPGQGTRVDILV